MIVMLDAMRAAGLAPAKDLALVPDGRLRRYRVEGDKPGSANGWAVLHDGAIQSGAFGSWKTGVTHTWRQHSDRRLSAAERQALRQQQAAAQRRDEIANHGNGRVKRRRGRTIAHRRDADGPRDRRAERAASSARSAGGPGFLHGIT